MKQIVIVLGAQKVDMVIENGENKGEKIQGISFQYLGTDNLLPTQEGDNKGCKVIKNWLPLSMLEKITVCPAMYELTFGIKANSKGKGEITAVDAQFIKEIVLK